MRWKAKTPHECEDTSISLGRKFFLQKSRDHAAFEVESALSPSRTRAGLEKLRVLDIGCGDGAALVSLCAENKDAVGLDLSETMLRLAKTRCKNALLGLVQGDGQRLPFAWKSFDACRCSFCFANIRYPRRVVREMTRVLRPGGWIVITDVVAVGRQEYYQVNCLERARQPENTRIMELRKFAALFSGLPLSWQSLRLSHHSVDFKRWIAGSNLRPGSATFRVAKAAFRQAVLHQQGMGMHGRGSYIYSVARFVLERTT